MFLQSFDSHLSPFKHMHAQKFIALIILLLSHKAEIQYRKRMKHIKTKEEAILR